MLIEHDTPLDDLRFGLGHFFQDNKFLEIASHKPTPREAHYCNLTCFYLSGHYYAALVADRLLPEEQLIWQRQLQHENVNIQQNDGFFRDYNMHCYDRPYGAAFGVMALAQSLLQQVMSTAVEFKETLAAKGSTVPSDDALKASWRSLNQVHRSGEPRQRAQLPP